MSDKAPSFRAAGTRLRGALRPELSAVCYPVPDDRIWRVLEGVHRFDKAHVVMLAEAGILDTADAAALLRALLDLEGREGGVVAARLSIGGGNHSGEKHLTQTLGEGVAGRIHAGRSSGDISAVANRLTQQQGLRDTLALLMHLRRSVLERARRDANVLVMGYSHLQHAQPATLGHYWCSWLFGLERDFERLRDLYTRFHFSPAGAAVLTGSRFDLRPERTAELLGFVRVFQNSRDAGWAADAYQEAAAVLAILLATTGRIADDLYLWSTAEFGIVEIDDGFCINSSILPQKKNPVALEHVRGVGRVALGRMVSVQGSFASASDSVVFERYLAVEELWRTFDDARGALELLAAVLDSLEVRQDAALRAFHDSWCWTSDLAAALVLEHGLPWRTAQQSVSVLVRQMMDGGRAAASVTEADVVQACASYSGQTGLELPVGFVDRVRDPRAIVESRIVAGGPAASDVARQIEAAESALERDAHTVQEFDHAEKTACRKLGEAVQALLDVPLPGVQA
ncbi:lyase family protein [Hydrogenophaga sp.]|uniref:lyase family protein n=1 Tax=Hydrogenophaga sp. TaxID=1904254 RepID=UPI003F731049